MSKIICSGALFYTQNTKRFLLLHRTSEKTKGKWGLVGGTSEESETPWESLQRECIEEIGTLPDIKKVFPLETFISSDQNFNFHTYLCIIQDEFIPVLNDEHDGYAWACLDQWPKPLHPGLYNTLRNKTNYIKLETAIKLMHAFLD